MKYYYEILKKKKSFKYIFLRIEKSNILFQKTFNPFDCDTNLVLGWILHQPFGPVTRVTLRILNSHGLISIRPLKQFLKK